MSGKDSLPRTIQVLVPVPLAEPFDYAVPAALTLTVGDHVRVPFGRRQLTGVVWGTSPPTIAPEKLKRVAAKLAVPAMPASLIRFIDWVAAYTLAPRGAVLKLALTVDSAQEQRTHPHYICMHPLPAGLKLTPTRQRVLEAAATPATMAELARMAACTPAVVSQLVKLGALTPAEVSEQPPPQFEQSHAGALLSEAQTEAAGVLTSAVAKGGFSVTLLEGVTGSGKTEVYAEAIRAALHKGQQVLVLMPEIALSVQMLGRFTALFGAEPVQWHSDLSASTRQRNWRAVANGSAQLILGARSALFLPYKNLGLVVIDEEHDAAYRQEEGVCYHARDMAVVRAQLQHIPVILSSATPSIETAVNVRAGRYGHAVLPDRFGGASEPKVELIDLLKDQPPRGRWLAERSLESIRGALARGEQTLIFLNRRGYAPLTLCRTCGHRLTCPNCTAWLVEHRAGRAQSRLSCHHCGHQEALPQTCLHCSAEDSFVACGPGVERIEEEIKSQFSAARVLVIASDSFTNWRAMQQALEAVKRGEVDIIIGTQIIAKGHHFPMLTQVIVVDADLGLEGGDLRARERTYQLLHQVGGRAGRAEHVGSVFLQTHFANNFMFQSLAKNDREGFIAHEIDERKTHRWPPFTRLASLIISGKDFARVEKAAQEIRIKSQLPDGIEIFGPAPAPLARLRGVHRMRLLIRAPRSCKLQPLLADALSRLSLPKGVDMQIIIDPFTFM